MHEDLEEGSVEERRMAEKKVKRRRKRRSIRAQTM